MRAATDERIHALVERWHTVFDADAEEIAKARDAVAGVGEALLAPLGAVITGDDPKGEGASARALAQSSDLLDDAQRGADDLKRLFASARELADARTVVAADAVRRHEVVLRHGELASILRRRAAKKWLDTYAPGAAGLSVEAVARWCAFWESWHALKTDASGLGGGLRTDIGDAYEPDAVAHLMARLGRAITLARALIKVDALAAQLRISLPLSDVADAQTRDEIRDALSRWQTAISAAEADHEGNKLIASEDSSRFAAT